MKIPEKITFRPGALAGAMAKWCKREDCTPSQLIRDAIAEYLEVESPDMPQGNPKAAKQAKKAARARWGKTAKKKA